ncbi:amidase family protein [Hansschlegelia zhihuaiae]|uniref:Amidase n=1 Tax=Hansschlegelia zhihuaiae TaxID=405005 RepID=A0A4Q0MND3_9HYPH|nr:amidase family protein [Hansschlegelia zhihuaiae]RXF75397.1 amidase [Hansschlegelia zhihuaiae]
MTTASMLAAPAPADLDDLPLGFPSIRAAIAQGADPVAIVLESRRRAGAIADEGVFTALVPEELVRAKAEEAAARARSGEALPLLGLTFSVKDNIHVAGMTTTANCPALAIEPRETSAAVLALEDAGAVLIGKNTLDQFATGLNGTRSPEPLCRNAVNPDYIPGGSSSGSAVAVARDVVAFSLGSDTGGSGRVPAACNGIVGIRPTIGLVSNRAVIFNSPFLDCIPIFARTIAEGNEILRTIAGFDALDPWSRRDADAIDVTPAAPESRRIAVPRRDQLRFFGDAEAEAAHDANLATLERLGFTLVEIDFAPFDEAGLLVFQSALVAERLVEYGDTLASRPDDVHPAVRASIEPGLAYSARDAFEALYRMRRFARFAEGALDGFAALVTPTIPTIYRIDEMLAEPMARNTVMGTYTYYVAPMDLCAVSVPGAPRGDGLPSAISVVGLAGKDGEVAGIAAAFEAGAAAG